MPSTENGTPLKLEPGLVTVTFTVQREPDSDAIPVYGFAGSITYPNAVEERVEIGHVHGAFTAGVTGRELVAALDPIEGDLAELGNIGQQRFCCAWLGVTRIEISPPYRGSRASWAAMRETCDAFGDRTGGLIVVKPYPFASRRTPEDTPQQVRALRKFWRAFGFAPMPRRPQLLFHDADFRWPAHSYMSQFAR